MENDKKILRKVVRLIVLHNLTAFVVATVTVGLPALFFFKKELFSHAIILNQFLIVLCYFVYELIKDFKILRNWWWWHMRLKESNPETVSCSMDTVDLTLPWKAKDYLSRKCELSEVSFDRDSLLWFEKWFVFNKIPTFGI